MKKRFLGRRSNRPWLATALSVGSMTAVFVGSGLISPTPALAWNATPNNATDSHWWTTDGCSVVPDSGLHSTRVRYGSYPFYGYTWVVGRYDFNHACIHHDGCYRHHWASKGTCDQWFLNDMNASCAAIGSNAACYNRAWIYYQGVVVFGHNAFNGYSAYAPMNAYA